MEKFLIKKSAIAGNGVFAGASIKKGERICFLTGEACTLDEIIRRVNAGTEAPSDPLLISDEEYLDLDEPSRTFNHSCDPNGFVRGENELIALRSIPAGEEITYDYSTTMDDNEEKIRKAGRTLWTCECHCGSARCRGIIDQFKTLPKAAREFYIRNKLMPDFMLRKFE